jgi:hypothetical protein
MSMQPQPRTIEDGNDPVACAEGENHDAFLISKPSNRGKFSPDRDTWDRIHQDRYRQWQMGDSIESIAEYHGVTYNAVRNSINRCEFRLSPGEVLAARSMRLRLRTISGLQDEYFAALKTLLSDESPFVRLKALEHIRRTAGMENAGVQVNQVNVQNNLAGAESYEERLARIRARQKAEMEPAALPSQSGRVLAMLGSGKPESE